MPKGGVNSTYGKKEGGFKFTQYPFSPTVLIAERRLMWYDEERFEDLKDRLKLEKVRFYWSPASDTSRSYTKQTTKIELYKKYPKDTPFEHKVEDMKTIIEQYGL